METNFFQQIADLNITGNLVLTVAKGADNNYLVSMILENEQCGDNAKHLIPRLNLRGTAQEIDGGFFDEISKPLQTASGLMVNMEAYLKQVEEAKKHSAMEKDKADKVKKEKEEKDKKFNEAMKKVDELEKEGKYREAWVKVPAPEQFPAQADEIRKRKTSLSSKFAPDLFGAPVTATKTTEPSEENNLFDERSNDQEDGSETE
ncbi:prtrc system protein e [Chitinophaga sp. GbtcB8]|uniref:prtrc system protein e n=1 Tax=Chitinophaga sp. GbtcB8 TaxID=2824753 RepID=UPI001C300EF2|nr:prtrc system protein e [Chitinophaga sp. GbtcB8]